MNHSKIARASRTAITNAPAATALDLDRVDALVAAFGDRLRIVVTPRGVSARDLAEALHPWDVSDLVTGAVSAEPIDPPLSVGELVTRLAQRLGGGRSSGAEARALDRATLEALQRRVGVRVVLVPASMTEGQRVELLGELDVTGWLNGQIESITTFRPPLAVRDRVAAATRWV